MYAVSIPFLHLVSCPELRAGGHSFSDGSSVAPSILDALLSINAEQHHLLAIAN